MKTILFPALSCILLTLCFTSATAQKKRQARDSSVTITFSETTSARQKKKSSGDENIIKIDSTKIQSFVTKIKKLGIDTWPLRGDYDECFADCFNLTRYVITLNDGSNSRTVLMSNEGFSYTQEADKNYVLRIHRVAEVIGLLNAFMPKNFPSDKFRCSLTAKGAEYCQKFDLEIFNLLKQGYAK